MPNIQASSNIEATIFSNHNLAVHNVRVIVEQPGGEAALGTGGLIPQPPMSPLGHAAAGRLREHLMRFRERTGSRITTARSIRNLATQGMLVAGGAVGAAFASMEVFEPSNKKNLEGGEHSQGWQFKDAALLTAAIFGGHVAYMGAKGVYSQIQMLKSNLAARFGQLQLDDELRGVLQGVIREAATIRSSGHLAVNTLRESAASPNELEQSQTAINRIGSAMTALEAALDQRQATVSDVQQPLQGLVEAVNHFAASSDQIARRLQLQTAGNPDHATSNAGPLPEVSIEMADIGMPAHTAIAVQDSSASNIHSGPAAHAEPATSNGLAHVTIEMTSLRRSSSEPLPSE